MSMLAAVASHCELGPAFLAPSAGEGLLYRTRLPRRQGAVSPNFHSSARLSHGVAVAPSRPIVLGITVVGLAVLAGQGVSRRLRRRLQGLHSRFSKSLLARQAAQAAPYQANIQALIKKILGQVEARIKRLPVGPAEAVPSVAYRATRFTKGSTPQEVLPDEILNGKYGPEVVQALNAMVLSIHAVSVNVMDCAGNQGFSTTGNGLYGGELESKYVRVRRDGSQTMMASLVSLAILSAALKEKFPSDPVLTDEDTTLIHPDSVFTQDCVTFLTHYGIVEDMTIDKFVDSVRHAGSYEKDKEPPRRYWAIQPLNNVDNLRKDKEYVMSIALMEDGEPVFGLAGCPTMMFDHMTRTKPNAGACSIFFAVKGQGCWTCQLCMDETDEVYNGIHKLKGKALRMDVLQQKARKEDEDSIWNEFETKQLQIGMRAKAPEDICKDAKQIARTLGSESPGLCHTNSTYKYYSLVRGELDLCLELEAGLHDKRKTSLLLVDFAACAIISSEANTTVTDLDGRPIEWQPVLNRNRGFLALNTSLVPLQGTLDAIAESSDVSNAEEQRRVQREKKVAEYLRGLFDRLANQLAESGNASDAKKAILIKTRGSQSLQDSEELRDTAIETLRAETNLLGDTPVSPDALRDDYVPMISPFE